MISDLTGVTVCCGVHIAGLDPLLHDQRSDDIDALFDHWAGTAETFCEMDDEALWCAEETDCP